MKRIIYMLILLIPVSLLYAKKQHFAVGLEGGYNFSVLSESAYNKGPNAAIKFEVNAFGMRYGYNRNIALNDVTLHVIDGYYKFIPRGNTIKPYFEFGGGYGLYKPPAIKLNGFHVLGTFGIMKKLKNKPIILEIFGRYNGVIAKTNEAFVAGKSWLYHQFITVGGGLSIGF